MECLSCVECLSCAVYVLYIMWVAPSASLVYAPLVYAYRVYISIHSTYCITTTTTPHPPPIHRSEGLLNDVLQAFANYVMSSTSNDNTSTHAAQQNNKAHNTLPANPHPAASRDALLCAAALVLCLCRPSAHHEVLQTQPVYQCIDVLLQDALHHHGALPSSAIPPPSHAAIVPTPQSLSTAAVAVVELLGGASCARDVPQSALHQPVSLLMWGLAGATDPERHAHAALQYRAALHARGTLEHVAALHVRCMGVLRDAPCSDDGQEGYGVYVGWWCLLVSVLVGAGHIFIPHAPPYTPIHPHTPPYTPIHPRTPQDCCGNVCNAVAFWSTQHRSTLGRMMLVLQQHWLHWHVRVGEGEGGGRGKVLWGLWEKVLWEKVLWGKVLWGETQTHKLQEGTRANQGVHHMGMV